MKRHILLLVLLFATACPSFAQIENEILQSKTEKIAKGRAYLLEKFLDRDYDKVKEIKDYLMTLEDDNYIALWPSELYHILQWTKEYGELTSLLRSMDSAYFSSPEFTRYSSKVVPGYDDLYKQLCLRGKEDEHLLQFNLQEADLTSEDRAFLTMLLDWLFVEKHYLVKDVQADANQTKLNETATQFLSDYPNSVYEYFVRHAIRKQYVEKDWGGGLGLNLCSGVSTGAFTRPIFGFGFSLDVLYKRFDLSLGADMMITKTKKDQTYSFDGVSGLVYPKGSNCNWTLPYADLSYKVYDGNRVAFAPFVGIGGLFESYPNNKDKEPEYKDLEKDFLLYRAGLIFDIKTGGLDFSKGAFRFKYEFGLSGLGDGQISTVHLFSVGWSEFERGYKRVY